MAGDHPIDRRDSIVLIIKRDPIDDFDTIFQYTLYAEL